MNSLVDQAIHEYAASLPAAGDANRSRRLIKCAKDSGHYPAGPTRDEEVRRTMAALGVDPETTSPLRILAAIAADADAPAAARVAVCRVLLGLTDLSEQANGLLTERALRIMAVRSH